MDAVYHLAGVYSGMEEVAHSPVEQEPLRSPAAQEVPARNRGRGPGRVLRWGCIVILLALCGGAGLLVSLLRSGPLTLGVTGGTQLELGSNDTVLSNSTFQNGTTYYLDLSGNGVRNILELNYLSDSHSLELVLHHSTKQDRDENHLLNMQLP